MFINAATEISNEKSKKHIKTCNNCKNCLDMTSGWREIE